MLLIILKTIAAALGVIAAWMAARLLLAANEVRNEIKRRDGR